MIFLHAKKENDKNVFLPRKYQEGKNDTSIKIQCKSKSIHYSDDSINIRLNSPK